MFLSIILKFYSIFLILSEFIQDLILYFTHIYFHQITSFTIIWLVCAFLSSYFTLNFGEYLFSIFQFSCTFIFNLFSHIEIWWTFHTRRRWWFLDILPAKRYWMWNLWLFCSIIFHLFIQILYFLLANLWFFDRV